MDEAPVEERRTQAGYVGRATEPSAANDLGALDPVAIDRVRDEARPDPRDADELHDALVTTGFLTSGDMAAIAPDLFPQLAAPRRATAFQIPNYKFLILAAERPPELQAFHPGAVLDPPIEAPPSRASRNWTREQAIVELLRGRLTVAGPTTAAELAGSLGITEPDADAALLALEADGVAMRGHFSTGRRQPFSSENGSRPPPHEWCERRLLARIHRYTLNRLRAEIEPVSPADFMRFLFAWQHVDPAHHLAGVDGVRAVIEALDGFELAADAWERSVLPARVEGYEPSMIDTLCLMGEVGWARLSSPSDETTQMVGATPIALFLRE